MLSCSTLVSLSDTCRTAVSPPSQGLIQTTSLAVSESMCRCVHVLMFASLMLLALSLPIPALICAFQPTAQTPGAGLDDWLSAGEDRHDFVPFRRCCTDCQVIPSDARPSATGFICLRIPRSHVSFIGKRVAFKLFQEMLGHSCISGCAQELCLTAVSPD